ncbi:MAG: SC35-like splicing factor SCL30a, 30a kd [Linnemannia gamsii]|nr:MAG: SC35-like splicing factor SCL30a, 30a kd [Linnemannia gamsii]
MPPRDRQNDAISLYVSGFKETTRPSDLATLFEPHGRIADVYIPKDYYSGLPRGFAYIQFHDEEDTRRVFESGETFVLDGRKLGLQYAQGRRKSPNQMRGHGGRGGGGGGGGDRRRSRSADRHYRPSNSSRRHSRSRSPSRDRRDRRRDSRSPRRRRSNSRSRSRSPRSRSRSRSTRRRSPSPRGRASRRSPSPRRRSPSPRRRSPSPRRRSPSPRERTPPRVGSPGERRSSVKNEPPFDGSNGGHPEHNNNHVDVDVKNDY